MSKSRISVIMSLKPIHHFDPLLAPSKRDIRDETSRLVADFLAMGGTIKRHIPGDAPGALNAGVRKDRAIRPLKFHKWA